jgi:hypothetical protein
MERFLDAETINAANPLSADDYAQRQFLYPVPPPVPSADFNEDNDVDGTDFDIWKGAFGVNSLGSADGDGDSDGADFLAWQQQFGSPPVAPAAAVPEPAAARQLVLALFVAAIIGKKMKSSSR